jgi:hypothetical protein
MTDVRAWVSEQLGRLLSEDAIRNIPPDILPWHVEERTGQYRRYSPSDVETALPQIRQRLDPTPPDGYVFRREAARMLGFRKVEWIDELGNQNKLEVHPTCVPRAYSIESIEAYRRRALSKGAERIAEATGQAWPLKRAARELGTNVDWLRLGWRLGWVDADERLDRRGRPHLMITPEEVGRIEAKRPSCECGCGQSTWQWWRFAAGHHMRVDAFLLSHHSIRAARDWYGACVSALGDSMPESLEAAACHLADGRKHLRTIERRLRMNPDDQTAARLQPQFQHRVDALGRLLAAERCRLLAAGLCEIRLASNVSRHGRRTADNGRLVQNSSLVIYSQVFAELLLEKSHDHIARTLGMTRAQVDDRLRQLERKASQHDVAACTTCRLPPE